MGFLPTGATRSEVRHRRWPRARRPREHEQADHRQQDTGEGERTGRDGDVPAQESRERRGHARRQLLEHPEDRGARARVLAHLCRGEGAGVRRGHT